MLVEAGPADPVSPISDAYEWVLVCQNPTTTTSTSTSTTTTTTAGPYYYTGLLCGGSIVGEFYSNTNEGDNPGIVYAFSATAGNTNQCFDNVSRIYTPNNNPILALFDTCFECNNQ